MPPVNTSALATGIDGSLRLSLDAVFYTVYDNATPRGTYVANQSVGDPGDTATLHGFGCGTIPGRCDVDDLFIDATDPAFPG